MKILHCRWRWFKLKYMFTLLIVMVLLVMINHIYNKDKPEVRCDENDEKQLVLTPAGKYIPKFDGKLKFKSFANLSTHCKYVGEEIDCPDVRHHGETMVRQGHLVILRMFKIIDLICKKHSIDYWLLWGSLIGAYRSKEMFPWDHDGDIGILYSDFERFSKILRKELPYFLYYQDGTHEPIWLKETYVHAKIRDRESCYTGCIREGCNWHDGLQIDIYIFTTEITTSGKAPLLVDTTKSYKIQYNHIFPLSQIVLDGIDLPCPRKSGIILQNQYGKDIMKYPKITCPVGFIAIPWHSCEYIENLSSKEKKIILAKSQYSMIHEDTR